MTSYQVHQYLQGSAALYDGQLLLGGELDGAVHQGLRPPQLRDREVGAPVGRRHVVRVRLTSVSTIRSAVLLNNNNLFS